MQNNQQVQYTMTRPKFCHVMFGSLRWQTCGWKGPCREREPMWNWTPSFIWASTLSTGQMAFAMPRTGSPETCWIFGWRKRFPLVESLLTMLAKFWPKRILGSALLVFGTLRLWFACLVLIFLDLLFSFEVIFVAVGVYSLQLGFSLCSEVEIRFYLFLLAWGGGQDSPKKCEEHNQGKNLIKFGRSRLSCFFPD